MATLKSSVLLTIRPETGCSFERIYFPGNDPDIYAERKTLSALWSQVVSRRIGFLKERIRSFEHCESAITVSCQLRLSDGSKTKIDRCPKDR